MTMTERENGVLTIKVQGRVDGSNADAFQEEVKKSVEEEDRAVFLDMAELTYISSAGLRSVLMIAKRLEEDKIRFVIYALSPPIKDIFEISGFDQIIAVKDSRDAALESLKA